MLKAGFIPEQSQRDPRELVRCWTTLIQARTSEANRIHKLLEDANIKLSSVASNIMGVSGRDMLAAILRGEARVRWHRPN